jgi:hypothetical protein
MRTLFGYWDSNMHSIFFSIQGLGSMILFCRKKESTILLLDGTQARLLQSIKQRVPL